MVKNPKPSVISRSEKEIESEIALTFNRGDTRLFKNIVANLWAGKLLGFDRGIAKIAGAVRVRCGIGGIGGSDRIGFHRVTITQEMVGKRIAVVLAAEVKTRDNYPTKEQKNFINFILSMGGIAGVVRSCDDVKFLLDEWLERMTNGN